MRKLMLLLVVAVVGVAGVKWAGSGDEPTAGRHLAYDRLWIDRVPTHERDTVHVFVALREEAVGAFKTTSMWRGAWEAFRYEAHGDELRAVFPQSGDRETLASRARKCKEPGWDYCLEITGSRHGVVRYYSREGWELDSLPDADAQLARVAKHAR